LLLLLLLPDDDLGLEVTPNERRLHLWLALAIDNDDVEDEAATDGSRSIDDEVTTAAAGNLLR
jgi:hypothetical protein